MDEQLAKIQECLHEIERQIEQLKVTPDKTPHLQSLVRHATDTLLPGMRAFIYQTKNIEIRTAAQLEAEKQGLVNLARYEAFSTMYDEKPHP